MLDIANVKAKTIEIVADGEKKIGSVIKSRRNYEYLHAKLKSVEMFKQNSNIKIFGDNNDDVISQLAAYNMTSGKKALWVKIIRKNFKNELFVLFHFIKTNKNAIFTLIIINIKDYSPTFY